MRPWRIAQATTLGTSHLADSIACQDSHLVDFVVAGERAEWLLIAVADGAGSASQSHLGSRAACTAAILYLKSHSDALLNADTALECVRQCFAAALHDVEDLAEREGASLRDFATTLQVAAIGDQHAAFGQVGDGVVVWGEPGDLRVAHWPEQEALNLTDFITGAPLSETLHVAIVPSTIRRVACMTDGLAPLLLDFRAKGPHGPAFEKLFATCTAAPDPADLSEDLATFLDSPQVNHRTDDDKTLVLAVRDEESAS
ncbi:MAG: protein phosphatase 2C domain-containing protein [Phycisphaerales bacterium]|nr:protein phosphatase 2C domain-containing protein [Phycisphaerales bacterium]